MIDRAQVAAVRQRLQHTWVPFFAAYGRLTPIQAQAIPKILSGADVLVTAPTASGKTEAVVAPVAEQYIAEGWGGLAVLYIMPTRALANDTMARIDGSLRALRIRSAIKHGDTPSLPEPTPNWLITTPESLDSLICRHPELLAQVQAVILDEIHLLDGTARDDQLRVLLRRLRRLTANPDFATHLLSATVANPEDVAQRYAAGCELVRVEGQRDMDVHMLTTHQEVKALARARGWSKLLYFCNLRETTEAVAAELKPLWRPYPVVVRHGALDRTVRETAEQALKRERVVVGVATGTLEIGIDIGDIDLVVLAEPPWSVAALLQRIGRGSRRTGKVQAVALTTSSSERNVLEAMFQAATAGVLEFEPYVPNRSVAIQQLISLAYQHSDGFRTGDAQDVIADLCSVQDTRLILDHLRQKGWLVLDRSQWSPTTRLMDAGERGMIHSNIPSSTTLQVVDVATGQAIGTIAGLYDDIFLLARQAWQVVGIEGAIVKVRRYSGTASAAMFSRHQRASAFSYLLPPRLR